MEDSILRMGREIDILQPSIKCNSTEIKQLNSFKYVGSEIEPDIIQKEIQSGMEPDGKVQKEITEYIKNVDKFSQAIKKIVWGWNLPQPTKTNATQNTLPLLTIQMKHGYGQKRINEILMKYRLKNKDKIKNGVIIYNLGY